MGSGRRTSDVRGEAASVVDRGSAPDEAGATLGAAGAHGLQPSAPRVETGWVTAAPAARRRRSGAACTPPTGRGSARCAWDGSALPTRATRTRRLAVRAARERARGAGGSSACGRSGTARGGAHMGASIVVELPEMSSLTSGSGTRGRSSRSPRERRTFTCVGGRGRGVPMSEGAGDVFQFLFEGDVRALRMARRRLGGGHPLHSQPPPAQSADDQMSSRRRVKQTHRPRREVRHERTSWRAASTAKLSRKQERPKYDETLRRGASSRRGSSWLGHPWRLPEK